MASAPRSTALNEAKPPDSLPIGVRAPATMTEPGIGDLQRGDRRWSVYGRPSRSTNVAPPVAAGGCPPQPPAQARHDDWRAPRELQLASGTAHEPTGVRNAANRPRLLHHHRRCR